MVTALKILIWLGIIAIGIPLLLGLIWCIILIILLITGRKNENRNKV